MGVGLSGMISGLDTDSIVKAMVSGQQAKATKVENKITLNKWTKEAWSGLNTKIYSFYTKYASKLRLQSSYMTRTATSSNESVVKATAGSGAAVGTHSLQVKKLASSQYVTGAQIAKKDTYNKNSKLVEDLKVENGTIFTIKGKEGTKDEEVVTLEVNEKTTINDFLNACKEAGLTASFDTNQQRFFISSSESGSEDKFSITTKKYGTTDSAGNEINILTELDTISKMVDTSFLSAADKESYEEAMATIRENADVLSKVLDENEYNSEDKTQKAVKNAIETVKTMAVKTYADQEANRIALDELTNAIANSVNDELISYGSGTLKRAEIKNTAKETVDANLMSAADIVAREDLGDLEELQKAIDESAKVDGIKYIKVKDLTLEKFYESRDLIKKYEDGIAEGKSLEDLGITDKQLEDANAVINTWNFCPTEDSSKIGLAFYNAYEEEKENCDYYGLIQQEMQNIVLTKEKDYYNKQVATIKENKLSKDNAEIYNQEITNLKAKIEGLFESVAENVSITDSSNTSMAGMGLGKITGEEQLGTDADGNPLNQMVVVEASNAEFVLDGATMTETSNSFTVNGITLNLSGTTQNKDDKNVYDTVQITVGKDVDSTYKLVKEAITEYNKLLEEMNTLYNADSARGYEPLTDEQKEAMTETDIENWEKKIKDSLLRRDDTLGTLLTSMRNALSSSYTDEDGKTYALSTFGIVTGNYTEKGKLHIYGDEEDATYATYSDRLKSALEEDPDKVMDVLTHVFGNLYETMTEKCAKTEISSALTFYNDKQYNNLLKDYEDDLDILEDRIKELEDRYYKQFTAMEKALSTLQNQSNSLASLLGTGQ